MGRAPCCDKANVKRGPWSPEEDAALKNYLERYGNGGNWIALPRKAGLKRCGKSCRLRWLNYLRPNIKHGGFTEEEDNIICTLYSKMGSRWSVIASQLPGRTDNDVKNHWNTKLKKKLLATTKDSGSAITSNSNISIPANNSALDHHLGSTFLPASAPNPETGYGGLGFSSFLAQCPETSPALTGIDYGLTTITSQASSNISGSSSCAVDNGYLSVVPGNGAGEDDGVLMELGFGFPCDLLTGLWFQEKTSEVAAAVSPPSSNSPYADIKPYGHCQSVINQY